MRATISGLGALLVALAVTASAHAWYHDYCPQPANAFSPPCCYSYWDMGCYGGWNNWPPCGQPFQGMQANIPFAGGAGGFYGGGGGSYARSPRDYFMGDP